MIKIRYILSICILCLLTVSNNIVAQEKSFALEECIDLAQNNSLDAFKQKNMYLASYWGHKSYLADKRPSLWLNMQPFNYTRSFVSRYNYDTNQDEYREQQSIYSSAGLSLQQKIFATGGTIYAKSDFNRLENLADPRYKSYSSVPFSIGISQPLFAYNAFKWEAKIEPLKFEIAKRKFLSDQQEINLKTVYLFFQLALAQQNYKIASEKKSNANNLYEIGKKRYQIVAISESELLNLELNVLNAEIEETQTQKINQQAAFKLALYLNLDNKNKISVSLPSLLSNLTIDAKEALQRAEENNPQMLIYKQEQLESESEVEKRKKDNRFQMSLNMSYGLNQNANNFSDSYKNPLDQQIVSMGVNIPILDWGKRKGKYKMALKNKQVSDLSIQQGIMDFKQEINQLVIDFNLQERIIESTLRAKEIANKTYIVTIKKFKEGKSSVLELDSARDKENMAQRSYLLSLNNYWKYMYQIQQYTHYNFRDKKDIKADFNQILE